MLTTHTGRLSGARVSRQSRATRLVVRAQAAAKELPRWPLIFKALTDAKIATISPQEAASRVASGEWILMDVRLKEQYENSHPEGSVSVPMYETIDMSKADLRKMLKAFMYKSNGVNPVDPNPAFAEQLQAAIAAKGGKVAGVITCCEAGGTLKPSTNFPEGKPSRSLQAAYRVVSEGLAPQVAHLERGVFGWYQADLPMVGDYKPDIGRTPMAAAEPTLQRLNQERGYEMRPEDKPVEAAKKWPW
ncbi:hypothetical protein GPECTOR_17g895 [Gonium pectorale]|uniref:Rhodanese domain-containing protein n=1 Tax=Gonium pectorale TaxID=33097 RepID=A0A150GKE2_GONPE|nr:hypothetical protein GPECTOR_17g895 [Gonium pectorale]|eukprot:KXZ50257.1 hypothetical protein GPECTOR_17g895 [Gonium pectorale]